MTAAQTSGTSQSTYRPHCVVMQADALAGTGTQVVTWESASDWIFPAGCLMQAWIEKKSMKSK